jgi:hypothetical protein
MVIKEAHVRFGLPEFNLMKANNTVTPQTDAKDQREIQRTDEES